MNSGPKIKQEHLQIHTNKKISICQSQIPLSSTNAQNNQT